MSDVSVSSGNCSASGECTIIITLQRITDVPKELQGSKPQLVVPPVAPTWAPDRDNGVFHITVQEL